MKRQIRLLVLVGAFVSVAAPASARQSSSSLSGPSLGYIFSENDGKIRPLLGMPGNSTIGSAQDLGLALSQALPLNGRHFLASSQAIASILFINTAASPISTTTIPDAPANPSRVAGSRRGTAAALYYETQQRVLVITGLPLTPRVGHTIDVSSSGGALSRMTVSDDGSLLLYSVPQNGHDALFGWTSIAGHRLLTTAESISDITLTPIGDAVVADARTSEIFSIADPKASAARLFLADDRSGVSNPSSVAVSNTGQIYVANGGSDTILTLDSAGQLLRSQQCGCEIAGIFPLKDSLYRLSNRSDRTLYLLEAGVTGDRVLFVPPGRKNQ